MPRSVLLVTSDIEQMRLIQSALAAKGFDARLAETGSEAIDLMGRRMSRVAVIDGEPPDIDCSHLATHLKALAETLQPCLRCRTVALQDNAKAIDGVDHVLAKPLCVERLVELVESLLGTTVRHTA